MQVKAACLTQSRPPRRSSSRDAGQPLLHYRLYVLTTARAERATLHPLLMFLCHGMQSNFHQQRFGRLTDNQMTPETCKSES